MMSKFRFVCLFVFILYFLSAGCAEIPNPSGLDPQSKTVPMKKYIIDLDQSPQERWIPLLKDFKSSAPLIVDYFSDQVP